MVRWYDAIQNGGNKVNLGWKRLGANEAIEIAVALKVNTSLQELNLMATIPVPMEPSELLMP